CFDGCLFARARANVVAHCVPTRRSSDLVAINGPAEVVDHVKEQSFGGSWIIKLPEDAGTTIVARTGNSTSFSATNVSSGTVKDEIGRAHVCTPVTFRSRMPSSACNKQRY